MKVRFTSSGRRQFLRAVAYILGDDPGAADRFRRRAERVLRRLERFPNSGRVLPEFPDLPYREVIVVPYRFFYRVEGKTAWVVAGWHGAQMPVEPGRQGKGAATGVARSSGRPCIVYLT